MSSIKTELRSFQLTENPPMKKQLSEIWKQYMSSFGFQKYYNNASDSELTNETSKRKNDNLCIPSLKSFFAFLEQNSITMSEEDSKYYSLISNNKKGIQLLSEPKIWIMFIIFIDQKLEETNNIKKNKLDIILNLFKEAIKYNCDIISLFEFFLIYISRINFEDILYIKKIFQKIPKEFLSIYHNNKNILRKIFSNSKNNYDLCIGKEFTNTNSTIFSSYNRNIQENDEQQNIEGNKFNDKKYEIDFDNIKIICKDYLNKGFFAIFQEKSGQKRSNEDESIKNPFINYDSDDDNNNYCLMPLICKYDNYEQKMEANKILNLINKSIYNNYTYCPFDLNIINKL